MPTALSISSFASVTPWMARNASRTRKVRCEFGQIGPRAQRWQRDLRAFQPEIQIAQKRVGSRHLR